VADDAHESRIPGRRVAPRGSQGGHPGCSVVTPTIPRRSRIERPLTGRDEDPGKPRRTR
jgi:hypothetical protein